MSKGRINYSLASMVYVELILARKVDWSMFPTVSQFPLQLQGSKKDILDLFDPSTKPRETSKTKKVLKKHYDAYNKGLRGHKWCSIRVQVPHAP